RTPLSSSSRSTSLEVAIFDSESGSNFLSSALNSSRSFTHAVLERRIANSIGDKASKRRVNVLTKHRFMNLLHSKAVLRAPARRDPSCRAQRILVRHSVKLCIPARHALLLHCRATHSMQAKSVQKAQHDKK